MQPNIEIYGAPETWHDCYFGGGSTQPWAALLHGEKAKVPTWALTEETPTFVNSQLRSAVDDNKLTPTQPIDNSICAVGQGTASPFRQFTIFRCDATTEHPNGEILQVGHSYTGATIMIITSLIRFGLNPIVLHQAAFTETALFRADIYKYATARQLGRVLISVYGRRLA